MLLTFRGAIYRPAAVATHLVRLARWFMSKLWEWVYQTGMTQDELIRWLKSALGGFRESAGWDPEDEDVHGLVEQLLRVLEKTGMFPADLLKEIMRHKLYDNPPAPYRWEHDNFGRKRLTKVRTEVQEHGIVRGRGFEGKSLIGIWWTTLDRKGTAHRALVKWIKSNNGNVFLNWAIPKEKEGGMGGGREYGGFIIVPTNQAPGYAAEVKDRVIAASNEGGGEYRLSAVTLDNLSKGNRVENSDQLRMPGLINSIKFNWDYNLPTLLNGRVAEYKRQKEYLDLVQMLREARDAAIKP